MAITPIQPNIDNTKSHRPYKEANGKIKTTNNVKPLPPRGHLVHDRLLMMPKFFMKDFAYDIKAVRDGLRGTANDHQTGRLNDVGLKVGGIGIATMLAARTPNPVHRVMEYAGLGAFLASMSLFPKLAIQLPSRILHGYDSGIEYIDDQGRKKSMFQDQNYIPYDMYQNNYLPANSEDNDQPLLEIGSENLDVIGDRMGIPKDIKNRHDIIKEQMRKIAIQNNTLWMLSAGLATPVMSALICVGLEKLIAPAIEAGRNALYNSEISNALKMTSEMALNASEIDANSLSKDVEKLLDNYKNKELPKAEFDNLVEMLTKNIDENASEGIKEDLTRLLSNSKKGEKAFVVDEKSADDIINSIKKNLSSRNKNTLERVFVPTSEELKQVLPSETKQLTMEELQKLKGDLKKFFQNKIDKEPAKTQEWLKMEADRILENISKSIQQRESIFVSEDSARELVDFAKVIGDFKKNDKILDRCKAFKFEHAPETVLARSYAKFEKTLFEVLDIKFKDIEQMKESQTYTQDILEKKLEALTQDKAKYEKAISKLGKVMAEMDANLNGKSADKNHIKDLITAIENNYNKTAQRLDNIGSGKFKSTINRLVKEDVSTLSNSIKDRNELFDFLDGTRANKYANFQYWGGQTTNEQRLAYAADNAKGVGSSKNLKISRIFERYQGVNNSFNRFLHLFDLYNREIPVAEYDKAILRKGKDILLSATSSENTLKNGTVNNPEFYKDVMRTNWAPEDWAQAYDVKGKGKITEATKKGLEGAKGGSELNIASRFQVYINKFRNIIANNNIDFTKPEHILDLNARNGYTREAKTRMGMFNLNSQSPVEFLHESAKRQFGPRKWMRKVSVIGGTVLGGTILAQLAFGKIKNPQNIQKQVSDDDN